MPLVVVFIKTHPHQKVSDTPWKRRGDYQKMKWVRRGGVQVCRFLSGVKLPTLKKNVADQKKENGLW